MRHPACPLLCEPHAKMQNEQALGEDFLRAEEGTLTRMRLLPWRPSSMSSSMRAPPV